MLPTALEIILRAARTAKRGGSLCATTAQSITQWNYAVWAATPPSRRVGYLTSSLWLRRPAGACGGLRGHLPAASDTDRALIGGFGAAAVGGRDLGRCFALRALALPRHNWPPHLAAAHRQNGGMTTPRPSLTSYVTRTAPPAAAAAY